MTEQPELFSCPFRGGTAAFGKTSRGSFVNCVECNAATNHLTENGETDADAAAAWNTRATPAREHADELVEALRSALPTLEACASGGSRRSKRALSAANSVLAKLEKEEGE